jgi:hypothetical protein
MCGPASVAVQVLPPQEPSGLIVKVALSARSPRLLLKVSKPPTV